MCTSAEEASPVGGYRNRAARHVEGDRCERSRSSRPIARTTDKEFCEERCWTARRKNKGLTHTLSLAHRERGRWKKAAPVLPLQWGDGWSEGVLDSELAEAVSGWLTYLGAERRFADNTLEAYERDARQF